MATRKQLSKRTRFEVFKRDHFTCQYCGGQPPDCVLVVDHIHPIAAGGTNESENLTTACQGCNMGKSDKLLSHIPIRPDADLLYLEAQQELAELRRFQATRAELEAARAEMIQTLQDSWCDCSGLNWCPKDHILYELIMQFPADWVMQVVEATAPKVASGFVRDNKWVPYMWAALRRKESESNG